MAVDRGTTAVLLTAYGGPDRLDDVEPYILDVRGHRPTSAALIEELRERYRAIGGRSPILERTRAQAAALGRALADARAALPVYVGMRHWHPYIADTLASMRSEGVRRAIGLVMAPHDSRLSIGAYLRRVEEARGELDVRGIRSWHVLPEYLDTVVQRVRLALATFPAHVREHVHVLFTAHSLPERILAEGDPYAAQLEETVGALAQRMPDLTYGFAYQSAAMTSDPWLGPDAGEAMTALAARGVPAVLIAPIGFTCEHVEILYDIDIEYAALAERLGLVLRRIEMMNDDPLLMRGLARRVLEEITRAGW